MSVNFEIPTEEHLRHVADNMRPADVAELRALGLTDNYDTLVRGIRESHLMAVGLINGTPAAVFGLVRCDILSGNGIPWLLGTDLIDSHRREFMLHSREVLCQMLEVCPRLKNHVHSKNTKSIRWLRWLGFTIGEPKLINGEVFHDFWRYDDNV